MFSSKAIIAVTALFGFTAAAPSACVNNTDIMGYSDYDTLAMDLLDPSAFADNEGLYIVCPFSEIMLGETDTLMINQPDTKLQCGTFDTGVEKLSENYCYIQGGSSTQITITNAADGSPISGVLIHGFEMVSASIASIGAYADYDGALDGTSFSEDESLYQITVFDVHISESQGLFSVGSSNFPAVGAQDPLSSAVNPSASMVIKDTHMFTLGLQGPAVLANNAHILMYEMPILLNQFVPNQMTGATYAPVMGVNGASISMNTICIQSNTQSAIFGGIVSPLGLVDYDDTSIVTSSAMYERGNLGFVSCKGTTGDGSCAPFELDVCAYDLPESLDFPCYPAESLQDLLSIAYSNKDNTYLMCPGVLNSTLNVWWDDITIGCYIPGTCFVTPAFIDDVIIAVTPVPQFTGIPKLESFTVQDMIFNNYNAQSTNSSVLVVFNGVDSVHVDRSHFESIDASESTLLLYNLDEGVGEMNVIDSKFIENNVTSLVFSSVPDADAASLETTLTMYNNLFFNNAVDIVAGVSAGYSEIELNCFIDNLASVLLFTNTTTYLSDNNGVNGNLVGCDIFNGLSCVSIEDSCFLSGDGEVIFGAVSGAPVSAPVSDAPVSSPIVAPVPIPSLTPSVAPVPAPVSSPSAAPSVAPVPAPVPSPSAAPSVAPVPSPTAAPSVAPVPSPSAAPSVAPVPAPVPSPSAAPSVAPVPSPSAAPSVAPVPSPSAAPSVAPVPASGTDAPVSDPVSNAPSSSGEMVSGTVWVLAASSLMIIKMVLI